MLKFFQVADSVSVPVETCVSLIQWIQLVFELVSISYSVIVIVIVANVTCTIAVRIQLAAESIAGSEGTIRLQFAIVLVVRDAISVCVNRV
jgi:hypothetical protein